MIQNENDYGFAGGNLRNKCLVTIVRTHKLPNAAVTSVTGSDPHYALVNYECARDDGLLFVWP